MNFHTFIPMKKENARKQTLDQLYERRKQVVRLRKKESGVCGLRP
jgi:hypothetical protein